MKKHIGTLLTIPALMILSGCFGDNDRGLMIRNNGAQGFQQNAREMGHSNRGARTTAGTQIAGQQPFTSTTPQTTTTTTTSKTDKKTDGRADGSKNRFVVSAPMTAKEICQQLEHDRKPWPSGKEPERDGVASQCEADIMAEKYGSAASEFELDEYEAIHPQRVNGFLVAASIFQNKNKSLGFIKGKDFGMFKHAKDPKDYKDQIKANKKRNADLGKNKNESKYSKHFWNRFFELKNENEKDAPALRRMFFGWTVKDGEKIENYDAFKPQFASVMTPINTISLENKFASKAATSFENNIGFVKGGDAEPIALGTFANDGSLQAFAGMSKETTNQRLDGSFMYVAETNLVLKKDIKLAIGHHVKIDGEDVYQFGSTMGSFIVLVDGEKVLYSMDTLQNSGNPVKGSDYYPISAKDDIGCQSTNVVIMFIPSSDKEHDKSGASAISDSVFFAESGSETYQPLHQGILSALPVQTFMDSEDKKSLSCKSHFFDEKITGLEEEKAIYHGDTYVHIEDIQNNAGTITITIDVYGVGGDNSGLSFTGEEVSLEGTNVKSKLSKAVDVKALDPQYAGIRSFEISGSKTEFWGATATDPMILKSMTIKPKGDTNEEHVWTGKKTIQPNS